MARRAGGPGRPRPRATTCAGSQRRQGCGAASLPTSCATPTLSRWPREGVSLKVIQRQLGHVNLGVTSVYLGGIDTAEIIDTVHNRRAPTISASRTEHLSPRALSLAWGSNTLVAMAPGFRSSSKAEADDLAPLGRPNLHGRVIFSGRDRGARPSHACMARGRAPCRQLLRGHSSRKASTPTPRAG